VPFDELELEVLGDLVAARFAAIVTISAWRVERYPENAEYIQAWDADCWALLELLGAVGPERWSRELGAPAAPVATRELARRRDEAMGALLTRLTYDDPVHVVRGEGVWLVDADGRRVLDGYNNVPVVGHCHPRVTEAVVRQTRRLNTHARYLYEPLVERLLATMPPEAGLDTVMLVNSGSEANDIAWRIATGVTGRGGAAISQHAYHGVSAAIADLSPEEWPAGIAPAHVARFDPPGGGTALAAGIEAAAASLADGLAATFVDAGFTSDGILPPAPGELAAAAEATRAAGGIFVADEVQVGYGRSGRDLWTFAAHGAVPDVVTLGKPMGNGYPVAALITRRELVDRFAYARTVFSTFGGNPVAAAAALAVLDVIRDERVVERVAATGAALRAALEELGAGEVRGEGLLVGLRLETPARAKEVVERLRADGVLIGRTGPVDDVLKIRPPLAFREEHVPVLARALRRALA
jgi:4-aminobutyrate aminotransferase-like enzyme